MHRIRKNLAFPFYFITCLECIAHCLDILVIYVIVFVVKHDNMYTSAIVLTFCMNGLFTSKVNRMISVVRYDNMDLFEIREVIRTIKNLIFIYVCIYDLLSHIH